MAAPAYVLGSGLMTCLGSGLAAQVPALRQTAASPTRAVDAVPAASWPYYAIPDIDGPERVYTFLQRAVDQALLEANLTSDERRRMAVLVGSSCLDLPVHEQAYAASVALGRADIPIRGPSYGTMAATVAEHLGIEGPQYTITTACSSSANALLNARLLVTKGVVDHALVIGVEAFNLVSVHGFGSLLLLSRDGYRPFDRRRRGLVLGEGAGAMVLGRTPRAGDPAPVALSGAASACDPFSPTTSQPDRIASVMAAALRDAGRRPADLIAVKAHGTATTSNDVVEGQAMRQLSDRLPPFSSLKPYVGHTLGGCGVIEALLLIAAWRDGFLPGTPGFDDIDPDIGLGPIAAAVPLPHTGAVLCNFFGFGGNNTSLVFERA